MDDTRDIAIRGEESAKAAHHRLDGINGQIRKLGASHEAMRADFHDALYDPETGLVPRLVDLTATMRTVLKVAGALAAAALTTCVGVTVYTVTHPRVVQQKPATATKPNDTARASHQGSEAASAAPVALHR